jgi:uncharacterized protein YyaL (SSP411 family)
MMASALSAWHAGLSQVVITGDPRDESAAALLDTVAARYLPFTLVLPADATDADALARVLPFTAAMRGGGAPAAYVCHDFTCERPVTTPAGLIEGLEVRG